jgi:hypothetical protein
MKNSRIIQFHRTSFKLKHLATFLILAVMFVTGSIQAQEIVMKGLIDSSKDKILVVTNREIHEHDTNGLAVYPKLADKREQLFLVAQEQSEEWIFHQESSLANLINHQVNYTDWVVFIHGDGKSLQASVDRAREIQKLHKVNVLVYSWPSKDDDMNGIRNFKNSYQNVELSTPQFYEFLMELKAVKLSETNPFNGQNLTLFLHSLGNYYLERLAVDGFSVQLNEKFFNNVIINAAAVEQEGHNVWVEQIAFTERIYINSNDDDMSLSGLRFLTRLGRQLGESAEAPYAKNAIYINFTKAVGFPGSMGPSHSYYFATVTDKSSNIRNYYTSILHGNEVELFNIELFTYSPEEPAFYIIF